METEFEYSITKEEINQLPLIQFKGEILVANTLEEAEDYASWFLSQPLIGFDSETKPCFKKGETRPIALIQIATEDKACLFRICKTGMPPSLRTIMEDEQIRKVALDPLFELKKLQAEYGIQAKGFIDAARISKQLKSSTHGLKGLAGLFLGFRISKTCQVSNWEKNDLTPSQLVYAATDAWVCLLLFREWEKRNLLPFPLEYVTWQENALLQNETHEKKLYPKKKYSKHFNNRQDSGNENKTDAITEIPGQFRN